MYAGNSAYFRLWTIIIDTIEILWNGKIAHPWWNSNPRPPAIPHCPPPPPLSIYIYTHTHTYIYIYIYMYMCVCVCVCKGPALLGFQLLKRHWLLPVWLSKESSISPPKQFISPLGDFDSIYHCEFNNSILYRASCGRIKVYSHINMLVNLSSNCFICQYILVVTNNFLTHFKVYSMAYFWIMINVYI